MSRGAAIRAPAAWFPEVCTACVDPCFRDANAFVAMDVFVDFAARMEHSQAGMRSNCFVVSGGTLTAAG